MSEVCEWEARYDRARAETFETYTEVLRTRNELAAATQRADAAEQRAAALREQLAAVQGLRQDAEDGLRAEISRLWAAKDKQVDRAIAAEAEIERLKQIQAERSESFKRVCIENSGLSGRLTVVEQENAVLRALAASGGAAPAERAGGE